MRKANAQKLAESYGKRWTIETMFQQLTETLTCEVNALGYPKAALFGFCLALMAYNAVAVMKAALRAVDGQEKVHQAISPYYLTLDSILKFFQVDSTGMFRMTSSARYFKKGVGSSRPN